MRILFLNQGRPAEGTAMGHVRVRHALETGLDGVGVEAEHVTVPPLSRLDRALTRPIPRLPGLGFKSVRWHLVRGRSASRIVKDHLAGTRPDVVHVTTDQVTFLLGRLQARVPCVPSLDITTLDWLRLQRGVPPGAATPVDLRPLAALERRALEAAPLAIAWTDTVAAETRAVAPGAKVATLHPGVDLDTFRPAPQRRGNGLPRVLFVGGRWEAKGGPDLLAALGDDLGRTVELHVVTPHPPPPQEGLVAHSGQPGGDSVLSLFQQADVLCLPTYVDAVPFVVIEALACGLPIVASGVGSIPEMTGPDAARLVAPGDVGGLRTALHQVLEDPGLRAEMGAAGRARAEERFDARHNTRRLVGLLEDVAAARA